MNRKLLACLCGLMVLSSSLSFGATIPEPERKNYQATPFWVAEPSIPQVLLIISKEYKMFYQAYAGLIVDFDGDGRIDTGFNPNAVYTGYFDPYSCYAYKASHTGKALASSRWFYADPNGYFLRAGATVEDDTTITRPSGLKGYIPSPRSVTGICRGVTSGTTKTFSGNWLNFMTSSRMDVIRKILYGGDRVVDSKTQTFLEASFVPPDAAVWGTDIFADDIWNNTPYNAYYDLTKYTPFDKPTTGRAHYFARVRDTGEGQLFPALRMAVNVQIGSTGRRYWDWVMQSRPVPNDNSIQSYISSYQSYRIKVQVCDGSNPESEYYGCKKYPSGYYKPAGLLQEYGESDKMYFGLMTGGFSEMMRKKGGIMRNHIDSIRRSIDTDTGQLLEKGLPWAISKLRISGRYLNTYDHTAGCANSVCIYADYQSWGNPLGEMLYEGVRYLNYKIGNPPIVPTYNFSWDEVGDRSKIVFGSGRVPSDDSPINKLLAANSLNTWNYRPSLAAGECAKPVIMIISDIDTSYDGDDIPNNNDLKDRALLPGIASAGKVTLPQQFTLKSYLDEISRLEGYSTSSGKFLISKGRTNDCSAKSMSSLLEVNGICPSGPSYEGTYSMAAVAYYAHTHDFSPSDNSMSTGIDIYAVTMSAAFPELTFNIPTAAGKPDPARKISVLPVNNTVLNNSFPYVEVNNDRILSYINYFLYDWQLDKNGIPFSITIRVNFSDRSMADDWEMDVVQEYRVNLLTDASTPAGARTPCAIDREYGNCSGANVNSIVSGVFRGSAGSYYYFKNPDAAQSQSDFITIAPSQVKGLSVESRFFQSASGGALGMGYTISGSTYDGTYIENCLSGYNTPASAFNTPPTCSYTGQAWTSANGCGRPHNYQRQIRTFKFAENTDIKSLPSPLWLAAKYGGFKDLNGDGVPDDDEWKRGGIGTNKDDPHNFFQATNISDLAVQLGDAFQAIADSAITGTANSASINSVLGGGLSIQTQYHTKYEDPTDPNVNIRWAGSVYALFVDKFGNLREDTNNNQTLELSDSDPDGSDLVVKFEALPNQTRAEIKRYRDQYGNNGLVQQGSALSSFHELETVWDVNQWISSIPDADIPASRAFNSSAKGRRVYSYYGTHDATGAAAWTSPVNLSSYLFNVGSFSQYKYLMRQPLNSSSDAETQSLIKYVLGVDDAGKYRNRTAVQYWSGSVPRVWRLGDVMNSKPIIVGEVSGNYHLLYGDKTFSQYKSANARRRQVAFFGANDGMLHAVNMGYYGSLAAGKAGYSKQPITGYDLMNNAIYDTSKTAHDLGSELWAYIPTAILPHLSWLADPAYDHGFYVDLKPYIVDLRDETTKEWKTVLIGGLRLGGRTINLDLNHTDDAAVYSYSEFFALDVTDPDSEPKLLWRFSHPNLGLSSSLPSVVRGKGGKWYVVLPSGPTHDAVDATGKMAPKNSSADVNPAYEGSSSQKARIFILDAMTGKLVGNPDSTKGKVNLIVAEDESFFNDAATPRATYVQKSGTDVTWAHHTIYLGLTAVDSSMDATGALYRLQMVDAAGAPLEVEDWKLTKFFNTERPVTAAVNTTYDPKGNLWVLFGTGRLWSKTDLNPCGTDTSAVSAACRERYTQYLFGVKEPLSSDGLMTFDEVPNDSKIADFSGVKCYADGTLVNLGSAYGDSSTTYYDLQRAMTTKGGAWNGYKIKLDLAKTLGTYNQDKTNFEVIIHQVLIDRLANGSSNMVATVYLTSNTICDPSGNSLMYVADTFTGLQPPYMSEYGLEGGDTITVTDSEGKPVTYKQNTGLKDAGKGLGSAPTMLKTAEGTSYNITNANSAITSIPLSNTQSETSNIVSWREVLNMGFDLTDADLVDGL